MKRENSDATGSSPVGKSADDPTRRTEIIHPESGGDDLEHPLDLPASSGAATTALPVTPAPARGSGKGASASAARPTEQLPYASDYPATSRPVSTETTAFAPVVSATDAMPESSASGADTGARPVRVGHEVPPRGTADLGLAIIRVALGGVLAVRALGLLFGLLGGPGSDRYAEHLEAAGFTRTPLLALGVGAAMLVCSVLLVLGLATPLALAVLVAAVGLGVAADLAAPGGAAWDGTLGRDVLVLAVLAGLLFTGPGRIGMDRRWRWSHRPRVTGFLWLVVGIAGAVAVWVLLRGQAA